MNRNSKKTCAHIADLKHRHSIATRGENPDLSYFNPPPTHTHVLKSSFRANWTVGVITSDFI